MIKNLKTKKRYKSIDEFINKIDINKDCSTHLFIRSFRNPMYVEHKLMHILNKLTSFRSNYLILDINDLNIYIDDFDNYINFLTHIESHIDIDIFKTKDIKMIKNLIKKDKLNKKIKDLFKTYYPNEKYSMKRLQKNVLKLNKFNEFEETSIVNFYRVYITKENIDHFKSLDIGVLMKRTKNLGIKFVFISNVDDYILDDPLTFNEFLTCLELT